MTEVEKVERAIKALRSIAQMTDADDPESYRCDDREGCLETVFSVATEAVRDILRAKEADREI